VFTLNVIYPGPKHGGKRLLIAEIAARFVSKRERSADFE